MNAPIFNTDWFSEHIPVWKDVLKPELWSNPRRVMEIGVFEGRASAWIMENLLTHEDSQLFAVDPFLTGSGSGTAIDIDTRQLFEANMRAIGCWHKTLLYQDRSDFVLGALTGNLRSYFDLIYVDGSHRAPDVLTDAVMSLQLLKRGGYLIFDDYQWKMGRRPIDRPAAAIDAFLEIMQDRIEVLHKAKQVMIRKC